jgi:hypothetical protein
VRFKSTVAGTADGNEIIFFGKTAFPPRYDMVEMQFNIHVVVW